MQQHKAVFALSLCRKAGTLVTGFDAVKESVYKGKAALVLCAQAVSYTHLDVYKRQAWA